MNFYGDRTANIKISLSQQILSVMSILLSHCIGVPAVALICAWLCLYFAPSYTYSYFPTVASERLSIIEDNLKHHQFWKITNVTALTSMYWFDEQTQSYVTFVLAFVPLVIYCVVLVTTWISHIGGHFHWHKKDETMLTNHHFPGISIVKPLMGVDALLEENLESHFSLDYPKFELLLCTQTDDDEAIPVVNRLRQKYPHVDCTLFTGGGPGCVNPMVNNMAPGYWNAKYDFIWISTSRIRASTDIIIDLSLKLQKPKVALVHQMPFYTDLPGFAGSIDKIQFGCVIGRYYPAFNFLGQPCCTGMSYLFKKSVLEECKPSGLIYFGKYLAEDFFLCSNLHEKGYKLLMSAYPAQQNIPTSSVCFYKNRMVRWLRLRLNMMFLVSGVLEPMGDVFPLGVMTALSLNHLFSINPYYFFIGHLCYWMTSDYILLRRAQNGQLLFSKIRFVFYWLFREVMSAVIFTEAFLKPQTVIWGSKQFRVRWGGVTEVVNNKIKS